MSGKIGIIILSALILFGCATIESDWKSAQTGNSVYSYKRFLQEHPESPYTAEAAAQLERKTWEQAQSIDAPEAYNAYLKYYPNGRYAVAAAEAAKKSIEPAAFRQAQKENTASSFEKFIAKYPDSVLVKDAKAKIERLNKEQEREAEFNSKFKTLEDPDQIEKLIDTYSEYKFVEKAIPRLEDMIVDRISKNGPGRDRFVAKVVIGTQGKIRNTISAMAGGSKDKGMLEYSQEFPGDHDGLTAMLQAPNWGENSILRFGSNDSRIEIDIKGYKYLGRGDKLHRLTFVLIKNAGFVYVRGKGQVVSPKGEVFEF